MSEPGRPACETCAHWHEDDALGPGEGVCKRYPPVHWPGDPDMSAQPFTKRYHACGEHPDFPAWLAELRASRGEPPLKQAIDYSSPSYSRPVECLGLDARSRKMALNL